MLMLSVILGGAFQKGCFERRKRFDTFLFLYKFRQTLILSTPGKEILILRRYMTNVPMKLEIYFSQVKTDCP